LTETEEEEEEDVDVVDDKETGSFQFFMFI
jgi:hypothetical protein